MTAFGEVRSVVDADAENLVRIGHGRQQFDFGQRVVGTLSLQRLQCVERSVREQRLQGRKRLQPLARVNDAGIRNQAVGGV